MLNIRIAVAQVEKSDSCQYLVPGWGFGAHSNASIEPVQISVLAWYRCPVPCQYQWTTSRQVTFRSHAGSRPCLASTMLVLQILLWYWRSTKPVVNFHLGDGDFSIDNFNSRNIVEIWVNKEGMITIGHWSCLSRLRIRKCPLGQSVHTRK